jgi:predicted transcriptional regulator
MARTASEHPTELELRILKILWEKSPRRVREIRQALADDGHAIAHTSVITMLNIMVDKRYLKRKQVKNAFYFEPRVSRDDVSQRLLGDVVDRVFDGSATAVMLNLLQTSDIDPDELKELRRLINRLARQQKEQRDESA